KDTVSEKAMVETLEMAPATLTAGEACFADELLLLELTSDPNHPSVAELKHQGQLLQEFFEPSVEGLPRGLGRRRRRRGGRAQESGLGPLRRDFILRAGSTEEQRAEAAPEDADRPLARTSPVTVAGTSTAVKRQRCRHCEAEETPQWRAGPEGPKTLCNACGVRYKSGRLMPEYRPASSPTFSPANHSNFHRQILEMRRQRSAHQRRNAGAPPPPPSLILR
ncbi:hypothetical protein B296_00036026, partial [Ensete ventricosum]